MAHEAEEPSVPLQRSRLTGWGRTQPAWSDVAVPTSADEVRQLLHLGAQQGVIPRGLGRSYGDAAQRSGGIVLDMTGLDLIGELDTVNGTIVVEAGVSLDALMRHLLPQGWFVPVSPGTRSVTIGGAIAADIHGKNHHRDGSFCDYVTSFTLVTPTGTYDVTPLDDPDLFWATAGGMGLTGVITSATIRLQPAETSWMQVDTRRYAELDELMAEMVATDVDHHYSVAWVDCNAGGRRHGRSILTRGEHASAERVAAGAPRDPHRDFSDRHLKVPLVAPKGLLNLASVAAFNEGWFRRAPRDRTDELLHIGTYFHPLDGVVAWNRLYGPNGFVQYQFVVNDARGDTIPEAIDRIAAAKVPSFLAVLKRFGPGNAGPLSFPLAGWTLALDFPVGPPRLPTLLNELDALVDEAGGRVYLAKDSRASAERIHHMYPRLPELQAVRQRVDPAGVMQSDLSRRLSL